MSEKKTAPERIYLQWFGVDSSDVAPEDIEHGPDDLTWCQDKIFDTDVEYVRVETEPSLRSLPDAIVNYLHSHLRKDEAERAAFAVRACVQDYQELIESLNNPDKP